MTDKAEDHFAATVRLYHHTTPEAALLIISERRMRSASPVDSPFAFFSTRLDGLASGNVGYGSAAVQIEVPAGLVIPDERFHSGEQFVKIALEDLRPEYFMKVHYSPERQPPPASAVTELSERLQADNEQLGRSLPGFHWHSEVVARGWEQPRLDGGNGGHVDGFGYEGPRALEVVTAEPQLTHPRARQTHSAISKEPTMYDMFSRAEPADALLLGVPGNTPQAQTERLERARELLAQLSHREDRAYARASWMQEPNVPKPFGLHALIAADGDAWAVASCPELPGMLAAQRGYRDPQYVYDEDGARYEAPLWPHNHHIVETVTEEVVQVKAVVAASLAAQGGSPGAIDRVQAPQDEVDPMREARTCAEIGDQARARMTAHRDGMPGSSDPAGRPAVAPPR